MCCRSASVAAPASFSSCRVLCLLARGDLAFYFDALFDIYGTPVKKSPFLIQGLETMQLRYQVHPKSKTYNTVDLT